MKSKKKIIIIFPLIFRRIKFIKTEIFGKNWIIILIKFRQNKMIGNCRERFPGRKNCDRMKENPPENVKDPKEYHSVK